ncbi:MAG: TetR/AcrR family transcriptional regulator [Nitrospirota bacterium]
MRTPQKDSPAKEKLLDAAQRLMLAKGFVATTVDEICEAAGLTKGSFFHYFESKEDLASAALDRFVAAKAAGFQQAPFVKKRDPLERVYGMVDFVMQMSKSAQPVQGCLLGNFAQELSDTHPGIRKQCAQHFAQWADAFKRDLDQAKALHAPKAAFDTQSLAEHFIAVLEGALILAKAKQDRAQVAGHVQHFKRYVKSLFEG